MYRTLRNSLLILFLLFSLFCAPLAIYAEKKVHCPEIAFFWWAVLFSIWKYVDQFDDSHVTSSNGSRQASRQNRMPRQPRRKRREHPGQCARHPSSSSQVSSSKVRHTGSVFSQERDQCQDCGGHATDSSKGIIPTIGRKITCPVCATEITEEDVVHCVRCLTVHHHECFEYFGECATYGCGMYRCRDGFPSPEQGSKRAQRTWVAKVSRDPIGNVKTNLVPEGMNEARATVSSEGKIALEQSRQRIERFRRVYSQRASSFGNQEEESSAWIRSLSHLICLFLKVLIVRAIDAFVDALARDRAQQWRKVSGLLSVLIVILPFVLLVLLLNHPYVWLLSTLLFEGGLVTCKLGMVGDLL